MKKVEDLRADLFCTLAELQSGSTMGNPVLDTFLRHKLEVLNDILDDGEVPEEYWDQIEEEIDKAY